MHATPTFAATLLTLAAVLAACSDDPDRASASAKSPGDISNIELSNAEPLTRHLVKEKTTCFVFVSPRMGSATEVGGIDLEDLARRNGVAVRRIEVADWERIRTDYDVHSLPSIALYDRTGSLVASGFDHAVLARVAKLE